MRLWIESAHQSLTPAGGDVVRTLQTEEQFFAVLASAPRGGAEARARATRIADMAADRLEQGTSPDAVVQAVLTTLPAGEHIPFSILQVLGGCRAQLVECDAPPLFLARGGQLVLLPVLEEVFRGHLVRTCQFTLQDRDHVAMVSAGYIRARGWSRRWGWRDIAISIRRWTDTGCDAEQLLGALIRMYRRLAEDGSARDVADVSIVAMHVRPRRTATVWTGPPADPAQDEAALEKLMAERGSRVICGDTTAQVAARLLGAELKLEPRPEDSADMRRPLDKKHPADKSHPWAEVPPISYLEGVDLVTEGVVTLGKAREHLAGVERVRDLPRGEDGATRLARALLAADRIRFIVGLAVNPAITQAAAVGAMRAVPLRQDVVEELIRDLKVRGKLVLVERL